MDDFIIENEKYLIRPIGDADKDFFMKVRVESTKIPDAYADRLFYDTYWKKALSSQDNISMVVSLKETGRMVATCSFQDFNKNAVSIGIDVDVPSRNTGIGTEVLSLLVTYLKNEAPTKRILIKVKSNNYPSIRMIEKAGGEKIREEKTVYDLIMGRW